MVLWRSGKQKCVAKRTGIVFYLYKKGKTFFIFSHTAMDSVHDNPKNVSFCLDELIDIVYSGATDDCLSRAKRDAKRYLNTSQEEEKDNDYIDLAREFSKRQTKLWEAWLELLDFQIEHWDQYPSNCSDDEKEEEEEKKDEEK